MTIPNLIARILWRISTFGPVSQGATIPADARPMSEADDKEVADMEPQTAEPLAGDGTAKGGEVAEGSGQEPQGSGGDEVEESTEVAETSAQPSSDGGTTEGAQEASDGALRAAAQAVRAAVDAVVAAPDTETPTRMSVKSNAKVTDAMMKAYEKDVEDGKSAEGLSNLIAAVLDQAFADYDEKRVLPVETVVAEASRVARNNERIAAWGKKNPESAKDPALWAGMTKVYSEYAEKYGRYRADRISMEQLAVMASEHIPAKGGKRAVPEAEAQKREALGAGKTPGAIGSIRPKATSPSKGKVGHDGSGYREHLKQATRDLW